MSHLNETQRYTIYRMRRDKKTQTEIARAIGVSQATVSKELSRNADSSGKYSPAMAQLFADMAKERSHRGRKKLDEKMESFIRQKMERYQWSPEQIKGYCEANGLKMVSFERIYQLIRQDKREGGTLWTHCRHRLKHRKRYVGAGVAHIPDRVSIHSRPPEVEDRTEFGHFEMDLVQNGTEFILVLTERMTRFLLMEKLPHGKNADDVSRVAVKLLKSHKRHLRSITTDTGGEFAKHSLISKALGVQVYFTDPYSSWQKGTVENTNKLIRQYIPKHMDISGLSFNKLLSIQHKINYRPRKKFFFNSPAYLFYNFTR